MQRYYALVLSAGDKAQLIKLLNGEQVLAQADVEWVFSAPCELALQVAANCIQGWVDGRRVFDVVDDERMLEAGGVALLCTEGRIATDEVRVEPA